ncbi:MAG: hypothetical protein ACRCS8_02495 [Brevinema sp.]
MLDSFKKYLIASLFILGLVPSLNAAERVKGDYLGLELGGGQTSVLHAGLRYLTVYHIGKTDEAFFDVIPTFAIGTGYEQVFRAEGGANFGVGSIREDVMFSFVMVGINFQINYNIDRDVMGLGPTFILPISTNVFWKNWFFGFHWGIDLNFNLVESGTYNNNNGVYNTPLFAKFSFAYNFN